MIMDMNGETLRIVFSGHLIACVGVSIFTVHCALRVSSSEWLFANRKTSSFRVLRRRNSRTVRYVPGFEVIRKRYYFDRKWLFK